MKIIMPTNWDDALIPEYKSCGVAECYGKLTIDVVGGGRPSYSLPNAGRKTVERHVRRLHDAGIKFNYLLNAACGSFREFTRSGDYHIQELIRWLKKVNVDTVTVTSPYFLQMIKKRHPGLKICVSTYADVDSPKKAVFWESLGADQITISHFSITRNFSVLKSIRAAVNCELRLIANTACLLGCPLARYHASFDAHSSQSEFSSRAGFAVDYCNLFCKFLRLSDPVQFITSLWIRPEDLGVYESAGIDAVKLIDRRSPTETLIRICRSYSQRRYEGNLLDLLPLFHGRTTLSRETLLMKLKFFFHPREINILKLRGLNEIIRDFDVHIDNQGLDGFINKFVSGNCLLINCRECGYCEKTAARVLRYDKKYLERARLRIKNFLDEFIKGDMFHY